MSLQESIKRILKEETTIPVGARRNLTYLDDYYNYEFNSAKKYVHRYKNKQRFIHNFILELFERFYQGFLSNDIRRFTDEFNIMENYVKVYVLDNHFKQLEKLWSKTHRDY
jgi:hypothetical protein